VKNGLCSNKLILNYVVFTAPFIKHFAPPLQRPTSKCCSGNQSLFTVRMAVPYFKLLVAGFPSQRPGSEPRSHHVGFVVGNVALGQAFCLYFGFPCQFSFHRLLRIHNLSSGAGIISQLLANVPSGLTISLSLHPNKLKKKLTKLLGFSPKANYADRASSSCQRS
jgi:hypothetical protein